MSQFLRETLRLLETCKTPTDYYRVQIGIQKHATPGDIVALRRRPIAWSKEFDNWLDDFYLNITQAHDDLKDYRCRPLGRSVTIYSGRSPPAVLVVAFCGKADLLFMPIAAVLQYLSPERHALLVLRDPSRSGFVGGMAGHSSSFHEMIDRLRREIDFVRFDEVRTLGTSGGGAPALAAGLMLNATSAVSFSGHLPSASTRYGESAGVSELERILEEAGQSRGCACVYGADNQVDSRNALALAAVMPVRLMPVPGIANHNVVFELHQRRQLAPLLATVGLTT